MADKQTELKEMYPPSGTASTKVDKTVDLAWENLTYQVQVDVQDPETGAKSKGMKTIVHNASGRARGGRVLALMGPSGAGKTTLLNSIAGRVPINQSCKISGAAFLNQTVLSDKYKRCISYVAQDDICMAKDTPREALYFAARCRCGKSHEEAEELVEQTISRLHLDKAADTILGVPGLVKGVSGGEKKRTNIGSELITNPYVLLLDEPTTGLDSVNAARVGQLLRELAHNEDRTVICTIHTPSSELFSMFDDLLLLAKGHVIFQGPLEFSLEYFARIGYPVPPRTNPSEYYMNMLQLPEPQLRELWEHWETYAASSDANANLSIKHVDEDLVEEDEVLEKHGGNKRAGTFMQLALLVGRSWRNAKRDPMITFARLVQTLFFAILMGLFFFNMSPTSNGVQDRLGFLFMAAMNTIFLAVMPGVATFPPERAVFLMEQANESYSPWTYFFSKTIAETPFQIIFPVLYIAILYFMVGLVETAESFFIAMLVCVIASNCAFSFGLLAASFFPTPEMGMAFVPLMILPMAIVGGLFANTERLEPGWIWLNYISFIRYVYKGLAINEFENIGSLCRDPNSLYFKEYTVSQADLNQGWAMLDQNYANLTFTADTSTAATNDFQTIMNGTTIGGIVDGFVLPYIEELPPKCRYQNGEEVLEFLGFTKSTDTWWFQVVILLVIMVVLRIMGAGALAYQSSTRTPKYAFKENVSSRVASPARASKWEPNAPFAGEEGEQ